MKRRLAIILLMLAALSCGHQDSAEDVTKEFLFRYFIELNQRGAKELSTGLAAKKLQEEIELTQSVRMQPDMDLSKSKPFLDYKLVNRNENDGAVTSYYDVTIETSDGENSYQRQVVITAEEVNGKWMISNYDTFLKE